MRKVFAGLFVSLDGVVESPDKWQFDHFDDDMGELMAAAIADEDAVLLGRVTYQEWASYWPTADDEPYASHINNTQKYVVSRTLDKVEWKNSTLVNGNVAEEITKLRDQPGKDIGVAGSPTLVRWLLNADLLDELILMIHPVVAGSGRRLFADSGDLKRLALADLRRTSTGNVIATYRPNKP